MKVTVLTPTIPERIAMLEQAMASVDLQTIPVAEHLIGVDEHRVGGGAVLSHLLRDVKTEWLMVLDDDDLLDPNHLETLDDHLEGADVVYSYCRTEGRSYTHYNQPFDLDNLYSNSVVSHNALVRTAWARLVDGWRPIRGYDLDLWRRIADRGAIFRSVPEITWTYRLLGGNESQGEVSGAPGVAAWN